MALLKCISILSSAEYEYAIPTCSSIYESDDSLRLVYTNTELPYKGLFPPHGRAETLDDTHPDAKSEHYT